MRLGRSKSSSFMNISAISETTKPNKKITRKVPRKYRRQMSKTDSYSSDDEKESKTKSKRSTSYSLSKIGFPKKKQHQFSVVQHKKEFVFQRSATLNDEPAS